MIKNNESKVKITNRNIKYYRDKGYLCKIDDIIKICVLTMSNMSHNKVMAICEICKNENEIPYSKYNINFNRGGFYSCKKCSNKKRIETNIIKHGVENIFQRDDIKENNKKWMSSKEFRIKSNETQIAKYDCLFVQTDSFKESNSIKMKNNIKNKKEKGEYLTSLSLPVNKKLRENAMFEKYGHTYSYHVDIIRGKIQKTNIEKFGHISPLGNDIIREKIKNIFIEKYGVDNPFKNIDIQNGIKDKRKISIKDSLEFIYYRNKVRYDTYKIKNELFDSWDGYDYYDGEYIKDYLSLNRNHNSYPSIDHKFSCFYGFINNLPTIEISNVENLCITKRIINSRKNKLNEKDFIKILELPNIKN